MGFPERSFPDIDGKAQQTRRTAAAVASYLNDQHNSNYCVWNLSEEIYDYTPFKGQVIIV